MRKEQSLFRLAAFVAACMLATTGHAQVRAIYDQGANSLARQLQRLQTTASVLHTGAHPDDEDSALIAYDARRNSARTAYLSLTRGSGGQNIIGAEQADLLGVIRTEELLQARRLDGATQYFTRAVDFGFSKHLTEAAGVWDEDALLEDMVRTIRLFRPSVIVSNWTGTPVDGHGHHQFVGYLTPLAYATAADPEQFPGQLDEGLLPWQAQKLYVTDRSGQFAGDEGILVVDTGERDPVLGRSYFEIGMEGRSQQKTQQMGSLELRGRQLSSMQLVESQVATATDEQSVFDGVDTNIGGITNYEDTADMELVRLLRLIERAAADALVNYDPLRPGQLVPMLAQGLALSREARPLLHTADARRLLDEKIAEFESALVLAAGISVDALSSAETVAPGASLQVAVRVYDGGSGIALPANLSLVAPESWQLTDSNDSELGNERNNRRNDQPTTEKLFNVRVPGDAAATQPYWLERPRDGFLYDWSTAGAEKTRPFREPLLQAKVAVQIGGQSLMLTREVRFRTVDPVRGELRRQINVVPALSVSPVTELLIVPTSLPERHFQAALTVSSLTGVAHEVETRLEVPDGWITQPTLATSTLSSRAASDTVTFNVVIPQEVEPGRYRLAGVSSAAGQDYRSTMHEIAYPHIDTHRSYEPTETIVQVIDVSVAPVQIGYVMGSGDKVPEALRRLGLTVTMLDDDALTSGDLSNFDTIVVGIRASQTRPAFVANNARLLEFARAGGALIVQYQQPDYTTRDLTPYPAQMERTVRVVDETAPVTILAAEHPVFNYPNKITVADFDGWVQERNNYNFTRFDDENYVALTESHDDGDPESTGGMVYARVGSGHYIYTGYSWFRQLPNGVPGAYRLFANLLSLPAAPTTAESQSQ